MIGLATAIWAGMAAVGALQQALDELADVPVHQRPNFAMKRLRSLAFLAAFGIGLAVSVLASNVATLFDTGPIAEGASMVATFLVNSLLVLAMFTLLAARRRPLRELLPGIAFAAIGLVLLLLLGSYVVRRFIVGASDTYGTFAVVIALLSWFHLVSRILLLGAQLNEVLADDLSPRTLLGSSPPTEGDRRAILLDVQRIQRDPRMGYAVAIGDEVATDDDPLGERVGGRPHSA